MHQTSCNTPSSPLLDQHLSLSPAASCQRHSLQPHSMRQICHPTLLQVFHASSLPTWPGPTSHPNPSQSCHIGTSLRHRGEPRGCPTISTQAGRADGLRARSRENAGASSLKTPIHHSARLLEVAAGPMSSLQTSPCARSWSPEPPSEHLQTAAVYGVWKP